MTPRHLIALAACLLVLSCDATEDADRPSAEGLHTVIDSFLVDGHATPAAVKTQDPAATTAVIPEDPDHGIGLVWSVEPKELQVFRSTAVHFRIDSPPKDHAKATCTWNFGDGSPVAEGCIVSHTFHGGRADQVVTLTLVDGSWQWNSTRTIPLERLLVVKEIEETGGPTQGLPAPPKTGDTTFRFAIVADTAARGGVPSSVAAGMVSLQERVRPQLVIHAGGIATTGSSDEALQGLRNQISEHISFGDTRMAWARSPIDRNTGVELSRPNVQMVDERFYPDRYSFTFKGAYFLIVSAGGPKGVDEAVIKWMREELSKAGIYDARYVVSYLPLHKFGEQHVGSLDKRFRLYELFLRARVTSLFSAGYRVYFNGHYGALPIVSVGALAGVGGALSGSEFSQPNSFVVVDQVAGAKERVFAVQGPDFDSVLDEDLLPESVEVYTR